MFPSLTESVCVVFYLIVMITAAKEEVNVHILWDTKSAVGYFNLHMLYIT